ncbi:HIT-like protein [Dendrothele bispora CBS 962.96]|uniref:HIT-like protein n=1 Tax=Dendrothele bispora (strain CBS 962.96) TaxID=1314807 RepID=A0A4S8M043_DENBC|nr:HIT-like protein [Dendrothele bispora CBS 962.96]
MQPSEVVDKIPSAFDKGLASGDLLFFPSSVHHIEEGGITYEIRLCPALQKKSETKAKDVSPTQSVKKSIDPFSPPYNPNIFVGYLPSQDQGDEAYAILMNKYSVVPYHFLMITKEFQPQTSPLMPDDLLNSYKLLSAARKANKNVFAFYNCGDLSGASQPHKHIQFIQIEDEHGPPIEKIARTVNLETPDRPFTVNRLSYANHIFRFPLTFPSLPESEQEAVLAQAFLSLLDLSISTIRHDPDYPAGKPSYNVVLTLQHLHLIPRRQEFHKLESSGDLLPVNSLGYAGMLLVKSEAELEAVKSEGISKILKSVGLASIHEQQVVGETADIDVPGGVQVGGPHM